MNTLKFGQRTVFENWIIAPKGYIFNLEAIKKVNLFGEEKLETMEVKNEGKTLHWKEEYLSYAKEMSSDFWGQHLNEENGCLVKVGG